MITNRSHLRLAFSLLTPFSNGKGFWTTTETVSPGEDGRIGRLPRAWRERYKADQERPDARLAYTVMSYRTPVAWILLDAKGRVLEVVIPDVWYSRTTRGVQMVCNADMPGRKMRVFSL